MNARYLLFLLTLAVAAGGAACTPAKTTVPPPVDFAVGDGGDFYLPSGTTLVPYLSETPVRSFTAAEQVLESGKDYLAVFETDAGRLVIDLLETQTPITVNSFVFLTLHHFHDGLAFHRVISGFVAQGGDPLTVDGSSPDNWGSGDPGYSFGLETSPSLTYDAAGALGMARTSDPNSNGSQFYLTLASAHSLDGMYTLFGHLSEGLDVLPNIVRGEPPAAPTRVQRAYIVAR